MQEKDYISRIIESVFKFIRRLLKIDFRENQKEFIQESSKFLKESFGADLNNLKEDFFNEVYTIVKDNDELKRINIILFRLSLAYCSLNHEKGKALYLKFKKQYDDNNHTFFLKKTDIDVALEKLITENKEAYE